MALHSTPLVGPAQLGFSLALVAISTGRAAVHVPRRLGHAIARRPRSTLWLNHLSRQGDSDPSLSPVCIRKWPSSSSSAPPPPCLLCLPLINRRVPHAPMSTVDNLLTGFATRSTGFAPCSSINNAFTPCESGLHLNASL
jgi:hypothetical protein